MKKQQIDNIKNLDLMIFDAKLRDMAEKGAFDEAIDKSLDRMIRMTEQTELSANELKLFHQSVKKASVENLIKEARRTMSVKVLPFGRYLQLIRDSCDLTKTDIARALNKDITYIDKIENGQTNPLHLIAKDVADIMQLFRLTLTDLKTIVASSLSIADLKRSKANAMARSSIKAGEKGKEESLGLAMDAVLQAIATKKGKTCNGNINIDSNYISVIKKILTERGEKSLLV